MMHARHGHGASIRIKAPHGAEITVRCADGDTTRMCADVVNGLVDRLMSGHERRREAGRDMGGRDMGGRDMGGRDSGRDMGGREQGREMGRDGGMDRDDGDRRERFRGEDRYRSWQ